jgi:cobalt transporter subunit CbtA
VQQFRRLVYLGGVSGTLAAFLLFFLQHYTTFPLIQRAEVYESAAEKLNPHHHEEEAWQPQEGTERTLYTAASTLLAGIGFALIFWGVVEVTSVELNLRRGFLWGLFAFVCVDLAPAWGLPPQPPGTPVADLYARQLWWISVVVTTAVGLWLLLRRTSPIQLRVLGILVMAPPHIIGAPVATGVSEVPASLIHQFALASVVSMGCFWCVLGAVGGFLSDRNRNGRQQFSG